MIDLAALVPRSGERFRTMRASLFSCILLRNHSLGCSRRICATDSADDLTQHIQVNIRQLVDVKAGTAHPVLAQLPQQRSSCRSKPPMIYSVKRLLARRETGDHEVAFAPALILKVITAEADNARAPHLGRLSP